MKKLILLLTLGVWSNAACAGATVSGYAVVSDGDTFSLGAAQVRLHGIDAPELGQMCERPSGAPWSCGEAARQALELLVDGSPVTCEITDVDPYGRLVSRCRVGDIELSDALVSDGLAWAFVRYSEDYVDTETLAKTARVGIWREGSDPTPPWVFRTMKWERAAASAPDNCPIKGNISRSGEKIYHTPWSPWYSRTQIDESQGEMWFCDEAQASAAGFRSARSR